MQSGSGGAVVDKGQKGQPALIASLLLEQAGFSGINDCVSLWNSRMETRRAKKS